MHAFRTHMTKGHSTARTRAWQVKNHTEASGEVFPPLLAENQPSDRAFNTLATILQAALVIAQAEHSQTSTLLYSASRWVKDCFEWHQEAVQDRDTAHCLLQAKQHEFEVIYSELAQCREALTLFQQQLSQHAHRHIRTIQAKPDGDLDHFKSVTISLRAQLTCREENIADLRRANAKLKQELAQARTDMELALEIATTQLEAEVHRLEQPVRAQAANTKVRVLPILRSSPSRIFKAWAERAIFQGQQHIVARRQDLDLTVCAMRAWKRVIFLPRWPRSQKAYHMRLQKDLDLACCAWHSWKWDIRL